MLAVRRDQHDRHHTTPHVSPTVSKRTDQHGLFASSLHTTWSHLLLQRTLVSSTSAMRRLRQLISPISWTPQSTHRGSGQSAGWKQEAFYTPRGYPSQGRLSPNNHGAIPPILTSYPPFPTTPTGQFLNIVYAILCNFMRVYSEFWKLSVRDNDPKFGQKTKIGYKWSW